MKRLFLAIAMLLMLMCPAFGSAAETSSDTMIMDWQTNKVWVDGGELIASGVFYNQRGDLTITKLNDFVMNFTFTKADGSQYTYTAKPVKLPMCKIAANGSKKLTLNFGKFDGDWKSWVTTQSYVFSYVHGSRW